MRVQTPMMIRALAGLLVAACGHTPDAGDEPGREVSGVWSRQVTSGETQRLLLFESGIMGFQRVGEDLPIARAYGRWAAAGDKLTLDVVRSEPPNTTFPLAASTTFKLEVNALKLATSDGERSTWTAVVEPYGSGAGAAERMRKDEQSWAYLVERR